MKVQCLDLNMYRPGRYKAGDGFHGAGQGEGDRIQDATHAIKDAVLQCMNRLRGERNALKFKLRLS